MHKHHPSHSLLFVLLIIPLIVLVAFTSNDNSKQSIQIKAQNNLSMAPSPAPTIALITPTYGVIAPCSNCISPTIFQAPVTNPVYPSNIIATPIESTTSLTPCETESAAIAHRKHKSRHHHHDKGEVRELSEIILRFLIELLNLLLKLIGGGMVPTPNPDPTISQVPSSMVPDPCAPSSAPSMAPEPTTNPSNVPSSVPSSAPTSVISQPPAVSLPITVPPTVAPTQTNACIPSGQKCDATGVRKCCTKACVPNINPNYPNDPGTCD